MFRSSGSRRALVGLALGGCLVTAACAAPKSRPAAPVHRLLPLVSRVPGEPWSSRSRLMRRRLRFFLPPWETFLRNMQYSRL